MSSVLSRFRRIPYFPVLRALLLHRAAVGESETASKALQELRDEIQAKDDALHGMSQQLLEVSAEKDELAQVTCALAT